MSQRDLKFDEFQTSIGKKKRHYIYGVCCRTGYEKWDSRVGKWYVEYDEHGNKILGRGVKG